MVKYANEVEKWYTIRSKLRLKLREVEDQLFLARCNSHGVHLGDVVEARTNKDVWLDTKITKISFHESGKPWISGLMKTKNGSWGAIERQWFSDWRKKEEPVQ